MRESRIATGQRLDNQEPGTSPVPHPVERHIVTVVADGQKISEEQRIRISAWLKANGVDPSRVVQGSAITVESTMHGDQAGRQIIEFTEYYENPSGQREINWKTRQGALTYARWVEQTVSIAPDPTWKGWDAYHAEMAATRSAAQDEDEDQ